MSTIAYGNWNESAWEPVREGIKRVVFAMEADSMSVAVGYVENGNEKRPHHHPNEQVALCLEGECDYYVDGVPYHMTVGSWVVVPPNVEHYIDVHDSPVPCLQMDIFTPARPEYTAAYKKFLESLNDK